MSKTLQIAMYPHGTRCYVLYKSEVVIAKIDKREVNEFDYVNYGVLVTGRKTPIWISEDAVIEDIETFISTLREKFKDLNNLNK